MSAGSRQNRWRQGDVLPVNAMSALGLCDPASPEHSRAMVVSHDCDLTATPDNEPWVEVILARPIESPGIDTHGKTARRLHLSCQTEADPVHLELLAPAKRAVAKTHLLGFDPDPGLSLDGHNLATLRHWLAARYRRSAFPENFDHRLDLAKIRGNRKIEKLLKTDGKLFIALLVDLDEGRNLERTAAEDCYQLALWLLYDSRHEVAAHAAASKAVKALDELFTKAFQQRDGSWRHIQLTDCQPISDADLTVSLARRLRQWHLDHLSLAWDPPHPLLPSLD